MSTGPFTTVLVANRGEIACRVMRSARELGFRTVAVYSDADADAEHVRQADVAVRVGEAEASQSYLDVEAILSAARLTGAQAIHPGYGFLSESAAFAAACEEAGLVFVGPSSAAIEAMGDKARAKAAMRTAGVPVVPGYEGPDQDDAALARAAEEVGFPLMVKAAAGGGGKGMRRVDGRQGLAEALTRARSEARAAFGDDVLLLEHLVEDARHVEVQILADAHGTTVHLGERDCSTQRRHQKVIEEAPSPAVSSELRARLGAAAVAAAEAVSYLGAGTVEFLLATDGSFYFLEMNTRLQVEHPVTEAITGLDLVALQLRVALGEPLGLTQEEVRLNGHAIEARIYAEDPFDGDRPQVGTVEVFRPPGGPGIRMDHGLGDGAVVSPWYDPMLAKLVAWGPDRETARRRLLRAIDETVLLGLGTNLGFLGGVLRHFTFVAGEVRTDFLSTGGASLRRPPAVQVPDGPELVALWLHLCAPGRDGFHTAHSLEQPVSIAVNGEALECWVRLEGDGVVVRRDGGAVHLRVLRGEGPRLQVIRRDEGTGTTLRHTRLAHARGQTLWVSVGGHHVEVLPHTPELETDDTAHSGLILAPGAGKVVAVLVSEGQQVEADAPLLVIEAMKLETTLRAPMAGKVQGLQAAPGTQVRTRQPLMQIIAQNPADSETTP